MEVVVIEDWGRQAQGSTAAVPYEGWGTLWWEGGRTQEGVLHRGSQDLKLSLGSADMGWSNVSLTLRDCIMYLPTSRAGWVGLGWPDWSYYFLLLQGPQVSTVSQDVLLMSVVQNMILYPHLSHSSGPSTYDVAQAALELSILPPQLPECWDYRCVPPHLALSSHFEGTLSSSAGLQRGQRFSSS
jgi:hypothetical protein